MYNYHSLYYCKVNGFRRILIWTDVFGFIGNKSDLPVVSKDITVLGELKKTSKARVLSGPTLICEGKTE